MIERTSQTVKIPSNGKHCGWNLIPESLRGRKFDADVVFLINLRNSNVLIIS